MNNALTKQQDHTVTVIQNAQEANQAFSIANLIFHPYAMERIDMFSDGMAKSKHMLPSVFHNDKEACKALLIKAGALNMDPFAIGAHAFPAPNGTIGFESKVYQAIAKAAAGIEFNEEYSDGWERVVGKASDATSAKGGKYRKANWTQQDEVGLYIDLTGTFRDGTSKTLRVYMAECHPRLSTNWANDPRLQTYYAAIKKWLRRYAPEVIMGLFDRDDLEGEPTQARTKDITPQAESQVNDLMGSNSEPENEPAIEEAQISEPSTTSTTTTVDDLMNGDIQNQSMTKAQEFHDLIASASTRNDISEIMTQARRGVESGRISNDEWTKLDSFATDKFSKLQ